MSAADYQVWGVVLAVLALIGLGVAVLFWKQGQP
jgi:hypothetical protein